MSELITLHPSQNNPRLLKVITDCLHLGGVIAYPTDSGYALGCSYKQKEAIERVRAIRDLQVEHHFTFICRDLAEVARYAKVSNAQFRILKKYTPGGYTFILAASREVPELVSSKRATIGVRIPDHPIALMICAALDEPLLSTSLILPGQEQPLLYPEDVADHLDAKIDLIVDGGYAGCEFTSVIDLTGDVPVVVREGSGDVSEFL